MENIQIQDVCQAYVKDIATGKANFFGLTTKSEVNQKLKQTMLRASIGNGVVGVVQSDKEISFKVTNLFQNDSIYEMQSGNNLKAFTGNLQYTETLQCKATKVTLTETPIGKVLVVDSHGKQLENTNTIKDVTITSGTDGEFYTCIYSVAMTGEAISLDAQTFPKNKYVELHTIAYDIDTNEVIADIYWVFYKALPDGTIKGGYEGGKNNESDIQFTAQLPKGLSEYGKYVVIPRTPAVSGLSIEPKTVIGK